MSVGAAPDDSRRFDVPKRVCHGTSEFAINADQLTVSFWCCPPPQEERPCKRVMDRGVASTGIATGWGRRRLDRELSPRRSLDTRPRILALYPSLPILLGFLEGGTCGPPFLSLRFLHPVSSKQSRSAPNKKRNQPPPSPAAVPAPEEASADVPQPIPPTDAFYCKGQSRPDDITPTESADHRQYAPSRSNAASSVLGSPSVRRG